LSIIGRIANTDFKERSNIGIPRRQDKFARRARATLLTQCCQQVYSARQSKAQEPDSEPVLGASPELPDVPLFAICCAAPAATAATPPATAATPVATRATRFSVSFEPLITFRVAERTRFAVEAVRPRDFDLRDFAAPPLDAAERRFAAVERLFDFAVRRLAGAALRDLLFFFELLRAAISGLPIRGVWSGIKTRCCKSSQAKQETVSDASDISARPSAIDARGDDKTPLHLLACSSCYQLAQPSLERCEH
jgi:hypothetical protein